MFFPSSLLSLLDSVIGHLTAKESANYGEFLWRFFLARCAGGRRQCIPCRCRNLGSVSYLTANKTLPVSSKNCARHGVSRKQLDLGYRSGHSHDTSCSSSPAMANAVPPFAGGLAGTRSKSLLQISSWVIDSLVVRFSITMSRGTAMTIGKRHFKGG